jgi:hypothetical protein
MNPSAQDLLCDEKLALYFLMFITYDILGPIRNRYELS